MCLLIIFNSNFRIGTQIYRFGLILAKLTSDSLQYIIQRIIKGILLKKFT